MRMSVECRSFLYNYTPESLGFTSKEEMDLIAEKLELSKKTPEELFELRNDIVEKYSMWMDSEIKYDKFGEYAGRSDKFYSLNEAMMSVTAVIDHYKYQAGVPVHMI